MEWRGARAEAMGSVRKLVHNPEEGQKVAMEVVTDGWILDAF